MEREPPADRGIVDMLWTRRGDALGRTGKLPTEFTLTPEEFDQLRVEIKPFTSYVVFNFDAEDGFGCRVFDIRVRVAGSADGR